MAPPATARASPNRPLVLGKTFDRPAWLIMIVIGLVTVAGPLVLAATACAPADQGNRPSS